jgi:hypothetical protein
MWNENSTCVLYMCTTDWSVNVKTKTFLNSINYINSDTLKVFKGPNLTLNWDYAKLKLPSLSQLWMWIVDSSAFFLQIQSYFYEIAESS